MPTGIDALQVIGNGLAANDGTGDALRTGSDKINANSAAIVTAINNIAASQAAGVVSYLTKAAMDADIAKPDGTIGLVTNDATTANNDYYRKNGAPGVGSWALTVNPTSLLKSDLASTATGKGGSLVGFLQAGTGAVARTQLDKSQENKTIADFGGIADGVTDFSAAVALAKTAGVKRLRFPAGNYLLAHSVDIGNMVIEGDGDGTVISVAPGFSDYQLFSSTGTLTAIPALSGDVVAGATSVTLASAPSLVAGDVFFIYNPTNSSFQGARTYYRAGEMCEVLSVSGTTVNLRRPLYDSYAAAVVNLYRMAGNTPVIRNMKVGGNPSAVFSNFILCRNPRVENVTLSFATDTTVRFSQCYEPVVSDAIIQNVGASLNDYGVSFINCQHGRVYDSIISSRRHAVTVGGADFLGGVPCRDIQTFDSLLSNDPASGSQAADFHGNTEYSYYNDCTIFGGVVLRGKDVGLYGCKIQPANDGIPVYTGEVKGGTFSITDCALLTNVNNTTVLCLVYATEINANTTVDFNLVIRGGSMTGRNLSGFYSLARVVNAGTAVKINVDFQGTRVDVNTLTHVLRTTLSSGTAASDRIIIDNLSGLPANTNLATHDASAYLNFPHRLQRQSGAYAGTSTVATSGRSGTISFPLRYPRIPVTQANVQGSSLGLIGGQLAIPSTYNVSTSGINVQIQTSAAMTAGTAYTLTWSAELREC